MINEYDVDRMKAILKANNGRHSDTVLKCVMRDFSCGPTRAGHLLHEMVRLGEARLDGLKVYGR